MRGTCGTALGIYSVHDRNTFLASMILPSIDGVLNNVSSTSSAYPCTASLGVLHASPSTMLLEEKGLFSTVALLRVPYCCSLLAQVKNVEVVLGDDGRPSGRANVYLVSAAAADAAAARFNGLIAGGMRT